MAIGSFVALGDSFTEGLDDPRADQAGYLGWADRFAGMLAARRPGLRYANLAVRGKLLREVAEEQVPQAIAMAPDLVSLAAGGNDLLRPRGDPDALAEAFDDAVRTLLMAGCQVLIFTGFDPRFPVLRLIRGKVAAYNMHLRAIAGRHQCHLVHLWSMQHAPRPSRLERGPAAPDAGRAPAGRAAGVRGTRACRCRRLAGAVAGGRRDRLIAARAWLAARRTDLRWARVHAAPWVGRRVRGVSSGDGIGPKRPELLPL